MAERDSERPRHRVTPPMDEDEHLPKPLPKREPVLANYHKRDGKMRKALVALTVLALLALVGGGVYWLFFKPEASNNTAKPAGTAPPTNVSSNIISTSTKHHVSQQLALEFDYPSDWQIKDAEGRLTVTSPDLQLTDKDGRKVTGQIVMTIRNKQQPLTEFDKGNAVAARESEKVAYTTPSQTQRGSTYLSLLIYATSTGSSGDFDGVYITSDNGYKKGQDAPKTDFAAVDPVINVTYMKDGKQITVADNMWDDPDYSNPIRAMLQSLRIT